jgi:hypothetical protein
MLSSCKYILSQWLWSPHWQSFHNCRGHWANLGLINLTDPHEVHRLKKDGPPRPKSRAKTGLKPEETPRLGLAQPDTTLDPRFPQFLSYVQFFIRASGATFEIVSLP